ncbi:MAG: methyltransferase, partial [bacterium]
AARRCVLYRLTREARRIPRPALDDWETGWMARGLGVELAVRGFPGVFSVGRLDPGTALLLSSLEGASPAGAVLDWGCGCGVVGAALMTSWHRARVTLADSNALAVESARRTLKANGLDERAVVAADVFEGADGERGRTGLGPWDLIVSNPPFHDGEETDTGATESLIREAPGRLAAGGRLRIVANRFLRYAPLLRRAFGDYAVVAENASYRVYEAVKPGRLARRVR